jgi:hypothetical protein
MTREDIIQMAQKAGFVWLGAYHSNLEDFAKLVAEHEREACANICKEMYLSGDMDTGLAEEAIQARGDGITLTTIRHPRGKPALGDLNPESLEQVEIDVPEPVAWIWEKEDGYTSIETHSLNDEDMKNVGVKSMKPLFTTPPQRTWVGLTDDEIEHAFKTNSVMVDNGNAYMVAGLRAVNIAQAIEAKLKEKNT